MAARSISTSLIELARGWPQAAIAVESEETPAPTDLSGRLSFGVAAISELAARDDVTVVNAVVGAAGLRYSLATLEAGNRLGLANKESMVAAGALVQRVATASGAELIPIDSEHSALHQCLAGEPRSSIASLILTASGGPFRGRSKADLTDVTPAEALDHPTWKMGGRITIDSATLVNKGLEVIEAHHLFGIEASRIKVVVHPQSIVHSTVQFVDGAMKAHIGHPDMRVPIQYALTYPDRATNPGDPFSLAGLTLTFEEPDRTTFPGLDLAYEVLSRGQSAPAAYNAADEVAVAAFLEGRIRFGDIVPVIERTVGACDPSPVDSFEDVVAADRAARLTARREIDTIDRPNGGVG